MHGGGTEKLIAPEHREKVRDILAALDRSAGPEGVDVPGFRLHSLVGKRRGSWAVSVSGNWRITFRFDGGDVFDVDYIDYH